ncbi:toxin-antitoxin system YwqK family antitoxin [Flavobacterium sp. 7A]|uniref:toxin-antitoxin system YwqK family antitoxin n=1 Tax=Flavobacterium sp. 7A TaxID=2940571 RepID=UPI002226ACFD|nr:hypothetical protein [Flavobacterium sp. 7A]MCW2119268.1 antitoxin component YwqK of YwqJK toxin-antitoxin module [Flavobacterium sp. 7A]
MKAVHRIIFMFIITSFALQGQTKVNQLETTGQKDGLWKGIYQESKRPKYEGTFAHGKEIGMFKFFDDTKLGSVIASRDFTAGDGSAYTIFYDQVKNKVSEGKVLNKQFEGIWKYYHQASPMVMTTEIYKNGKLDGLRSVYYLSGKLAEVTNYKNGVKDGVYKKYSENEIVLEEATYLADEYNGLATYKEADGKMVSQGKFLKGKKVGVWQFFEDGKLKKEINMSVPSVAKGSKSK